MFQVFWSKGAGRLRRWSSLLSLVLIFNLLGAEVAQADVNGALDDYFNNGAIGTANVTGPVAYHGQAAGYYSGGSIFIRSQNKVISPGNVQLPSVKVGCGGIDIFSGSFSFINTDQIVAAAKAAANGALSFVFQMAIDAISPIISKNLSDVMQKLQQFNQTSLNACAAGEAAAAGLLGKSQARDEFLCQATGNASGLFSDWAAAKNGCGTGGNRNSTLASNSDPKIPTGSFNYTWSTLTTSYPSMDTDLKQFIMSLVGTVVRTAGTDDSTSGSFAYIGPGDTGLISALLDGGSNAKVWKCDTTDKCLNPLPTTLTISATSALKPRVYALITDIAARIQSNTALTAQEIGLLGSTNVPVYKILAVGMSTQFGAINDVDVQELSEIVAVDMLHDMVKQLYGTIISAQGSFQNAETSSMDQWRQQLLSVGQSIDGLTITTNNRLQRTEMIVDRTMKLEGRLREALAPQMLAALRFAKATGTQGLQ